MLNVYVMIFQDTSNSTGWGKDVAHRNVYSQEQGPLETTISRKY